MVRSSAASSTPGDEVPSKDQPQRRSKCELEEKIEVAYVTCLRKHIPMPFSTQWAASSEKDSELSQQAKLDSLQDGPSLEPPPPHGYAEDSAGLGNPASGQATPQPLAA